jgi:hypothetical protein
MFMTDPTHTIRSRPKDMARPRRRAVSAVTVSV